MPQRRRRRPLVGALSALLAALLLPVASAGAAPSSAPAVPSDAPATHDAPVLRAATADDLAGAPAEELAAVRAAPGVGVPAGVPVVDGWWSVRSALLPDVAAAMAAAGTPLLEAAPVGRFELLADAPVRVDAAAQAHRGGVPVDAAAATGVPVVPGDPRSDLQWHLAEVEVPRAWRRSTGEGAVVAVVDSGITPGPDLACRTFAGEFDATGGSADVEDGAGHGTHVAGTIGQCSRNDRGTAGVAPDVTLLDVKVLGGDPTAPGAGNGFDVARGVLWAVDNGADVINLSLTGTCSDRAPTWEAGCGDALLDAAIARAVAADVLVVAAAGNDGGTRVGYPANHPDVVAVGSLDASRSRAPYSARGVALDLVGPGGVARDADGDGVVDYVYQEGYDVDFDDHALFGMVGTSMAAPHVTGIAALLRGAAPEASAEQVREALLASACDVGARGPDRATGAGIVQAHNALRVLLRTDDVPSCFADVPASSPFARDVAALSRRRVTRGCDELQTRFCPERRVTRGQLAGMLAAALELPARGTSAFDDDDGSPFEGAIAAVADAGITTGCEVRVDGTERFCPSAPVTRAQLAALLVAGFRLPLVEGDAFLDDDGSPFEGAIEALAASGISRGCNPPVADRYCGDQPVTRLELAAFLHRALQRSGSVG